MDPICVIGDAQTVNAFRIAGVKGIPSLPGYAATMLEEVLSEGNASLILITRECASGIERRIKDINFESPEVTVIKINGIDDEGGFGVSLMAFITEALGVAL